MLGPLPTHSATPSVHLTYPHPSLFTFPPASEPKVLTPPASDHTLARPFDINPQTYNDLLSVNWPVTIAIIYATTVSILNRVNKRRGNKPWAFSKSYPFYAFVLLHNIFLAIYSAWTFVGMFQALRAVWPGWDGKYGTAGVVDAFCKLNGPRGLGNAATYNFTNNVWGYTNKALKLTTGGLPDSTDVGRLWNEGLAYYGWLFYLSKFYEVVDTLIVLAKGKKSSLLQTYHHAGAMMCMWAGIRYMAPPIWMFVTVNSLIHAMMYTYYAVAAVGIRIPQAIKRTLTTLQISQFIIGALYAAAHLFVAYDVPVSVPYTFVHNLSSAIPEAASSVSSAIASVTASAGTAHWLKKMAFRAAGEEGLAENVRNSQGEAFGVDAVHAQREEKAREEIRYRNEYKTIPCTDTSGQTFAILLNVFYLLPLTWLFVDFFVRSYLRRTSSSVGRPTHEHAVSKSRHDATKGVERELREAMEEDQTRGDIQAPTDLSTQVNQLKSNVKQGVDKLSHQAEEGLGKAREVVNKGKENAKGYAQKAVDEGRAGAKDVTNYAQKKLSEAKSGAKDAADKAQPKVEQTKNNLKDSIEKAQQKVEQSKGDAKAGLEKAQKTMDQSKAKAQEKAEQGKAAMKDGAEKAQQKTEQGKAAMKDGAQKAQQKTEQGKAATKDGLDNAGKKADQAKATTKDTAEKARGKAEQGKEAAKEGAQKTQKKAEQGKADVKNAGADDNEHNSSDGELVSNDGQDDTTAYEANPDVIKDDKEMEAERKMQPQAKSEGKSDSGNGNGKEGEGEDAAALEASIDEVTSRDEKEAEKEMQPNGA